MASATDSLAVSTSSLSADERRALLEGFTDEELALLEHAWWFWARASQLPPPGDWRTWLLLAGRGFGKTRAGAEFVRDRVEHGGWRRVALVGATAADVRDVMVEGESGLLAVSPPDNRPLYEPSKRRLTWPNGAIATTYSADEPARLRGPQHDGAWADELAAWRYPDAWDQLQFGLRLGADPRVVVTTTPKPTKIVRDLMGDPTTVVTRGDTYENAVHLAPAFLAKIVRKYEGTRLGRQELHAEILDDTPGALWTRALLDDLRVRAAPDLVRVVVGVDPAATSGEDADETGVVVCGLGVDGHGYVLDDRTLQDTPRGWASAAVGAYRDHRADRIVAEVNNGGEMVGYTIATVDPAVPFKAVYASRGKQTRAEPVSSLYEVRRVHHVGSFAALEDQMCTWTPGMPSPDRMDALVWALTELFLEPDEVEGLVTHDDRVEISGY